MMRRLLALFCACGWALTAFFAWRRGRRTAVVAQETGAEAESPGARKAYRNLVAACTSGAAAPARKAIIAWADALVDEGRVTSLSEVKALFADSGLDAALEGLEASLFGNAAGAWNGAELKAAAEHLQKNWPGRSAGKAAQPEFALYPGA